MTGSTCHFVDQPRRCTVKHKGRIDRDRRSGSPVHIEQNLARRSLPGCHRLSARLRSLDDDRAGRCESSGTVPRLRYGVDKSWLDAAAARLSCIQRQKCRSCSGRTARTGRSHPRSSGCRVAAGLQRARHPGRRGTGPAERAPGFVTFRRKFVLATAGGVAASRLLASVRAPTIGMQYT